MDHLPPVEDPALPLLEVPYLCEGLPYDQGDFSDYPQRRGIHLAQLEERLRGNVEISAGAWSETLQFLQSWLYMGLVHEFYQYIIRPCDEVFFVRFFVRTNSEGRNVICTKQLSRLLGVWVSWNKTGPEATRDALNRSLQKSLDTVRDYVTLIPMGNILEEIPAPPAIPQEVQDILLSITILQTSLLHALCRAEGYDGFGVDMPHILESPFVFQRLLEGRMCPRLIGLLSTHLGPLELLYAGQLRRYGTQQDHRSCSMKECVHSIVDEASYRMKHVSYCGGCSILSVNQDDIAACLDVGDYPLIVLEASRDSTGEVRPQLQVRRRNEGRPYVAFSHVWSDGLGNPHSNSLPTCQVLRLAESLMDLSGQEFSAAELSKMTVEERRRIASWSALRNNGEQSILFWIDTLCIPTERNLKQKALNKLHDTFSNAQHVVVLDAELEQTSWQTPILESLMRIRLSKWMTRLWTLEEAILARAGSLCILFKDGMFPLDDSMEEAKRINDSDDLLHRVMQLTTFRPFRRILRIKNISRVEKVTELGHLMVTRSTTKAGNETLIIATALGLDNGVLFNTPVEQRTQKLLELVRYWPLHILFNNMLNRMTEPGYRWAPRSFLGKGISPFMLGSANLTLDQDSTGEQIYPNLIRLEEGTLQTDGGLLVTLPGFRFKTDTLPVGEKVIGPEDEMMCFFFFDVNSKAWYGVRHIRYIGDQPWHALRQARSSRHKRFAIVLPTDIPAGGICEGVLVSIYGAGDDGAVLYSEFLCLVKLFRTSSPSFAALFSLGALPNVVPSIDGILPASRMLCEEILTDMWEQTGSLEESLGKEVRDQGPREKAVDMFRKMFCPAWKVGSGQKWCIG